MRFFVMPALAWAALALAVARAQDDKPKEDPAHDELRAVRDAMVKAVNSNDRDAMLKHLHTNVVVTWLDGSVSRGPDQVRAYYDRMMTGDQRVVESVSINPTVDELSALYGNTAVAWGSSNDHFRLRNGLDFSVKSRWSATLVKEDGRWQIVNFHASTDLFDNALLDVQKRVTYWAGGIAAVVGLAVGFGVGRFMRRGRPVSA
jgi:uncharacterized protein (TIGR02246 family)